MSDLKLRRVYWDWPARRASTYDDTFQLYKTAKNGTDGNRNETKLFHFLYCYCFKSVGDTLPGRGFCPRCIFFKIAVYF